MHHAEIDFRDFVSDANPSNYNGDNDVTGNVQQFFVAAKEGIGVIPKGRFGVSSTLAVYDRDHCMIRGAGPKSTTFAIDPAFSGSLFQLGHMSDVTNANDYDWPRTPDAAIMVALGFDGLNRTASADIFEFTERTDNLLLEDIDVESVAGTVIKVVGGESQAVRESVFQRLRMRACGAQDKPVVDFYAMEGHSGDKSNNVQFNDCHLIFPFSDGLRLRCDATNGAVRELSWLGGMLHGHGQDGTPANLVRATGHVHNFEIAPLSISTPVTQSSNDFYTLLEASPVNSQLKPAAFEFRGRYLNRGPGGLFKITGAAGGRISGQIASTASPAGLELLVTSGALDYPLYWQPLWSVPGNRLVAPDQLSLVHVL